MIFIEKTQKSIQIPKHTVPKWDNPQPSLTLYFTHKLTEERHDFNQVVDVGQSSSYWVFNNLDFTTLQSGEYEYFLTSDILEPLELGLLQVLGDTKDTISYKKESNTIQYNG